MISPLLANLYLHWLDKRFKATTGPAQFAAAELVRYADDFVILARYQGSRIHDWVEALVEGRLGLTVNRDKTRVVRLREEGASLDFLGYTFRYAPDLFGRPKRYLTRVPSAKACARERERLRELTDARRGHVPIEDLIVEVNRQVLGWGRYFERGHSRAAFRRMNRFLQQRMRRHLQRRSQRPYRLPNGVTWYRHLTQDLGLVQL